MAIGVDVGRVGIRRPVHIAIVVVTQCDRGLIIDVHGRAADHQRRVARLCATAYHDLALAHQVDRGAGAAGREHGGVIVKIDPAGVEVYLIGGGDAGAVLKRKCRVGKRKRSVHRDRSVVARDSHRSPGEISRRLAAGEEQGERSIREYDRPAVEGAVHTGSSLIDGQRRIARNDDRTVDTACGDGGRPAAIGIDLIGGLAKSAQGDQAQEECVDTVFHTRRCLGYQDARYRPKAMPRCNYLKIKAI